MRFHAKYGKIGLNVFKLFEIWGKTSLIFSQKIYSPISEIRRKMFNNFLLIGS